LSETAAVPAGRARAVVPLGLALLALLLPVRSASQAIFAGSFALALISMALWGLLLARFVLRLPRLGPWTAVYLGQFALLAAAAPVLGLNHLAAATLGRSLPLIALVVPATAILAARQARSFRPPARVDLFALLGLGSVAVVVAIYSSHLSALGLDLHEHIAWVRQIVSRGFIPIDEGGTGIVGDYPRTFHLLTALWNAAGLTAPAGPFAKAMPFLQNALPLLALAEQAIDVQAAGAPAARRKWEITLGLAFYVYAFLLLPVVYPIFDLIGTPRFSSGGLLLLPIVLVAIARAQQAPRASLLALASTPLLAVWAITWNPLIVLLLPAATAPLLIAIWVALRPPRIAQGSLRAHATALAVCGALASVAVVQDPWVVQMAARRIPVCRRLLERAGLVTLDEAVRRGLATARENALHDPAAVPPCPDVPCVLRVAGGAAVDALAVPWTCARAVVASLATLFPPSLSRLRDAFRDAVPLRGALLADYAGLPFAIFLLAGVVAWSVRRLRREPAGPKPSSIADSLLPASLAGIAAAGVGVAFVAGMASALNDQRHESTLLAGYLGVAGSHLSLSFLWLPFMASALALAGPLIARASPRPEHTPSSRTARIQATAALALWLALPLAARLNLDRPLRHHGFWTRIGIEDLQALRTLEAAIPPADGVIIPAEHANIGGEHWVLPLGETAALLPYGERRYLFNVQLGASYPLSWRDLDQGLCSKDALARSRFLERTRARWFLVRDLKARDAGAAIHRPQPWICGLSFAALGAELPAVREERGIFLFRLGPSPPGADRAAR